MQLKTYHDFIERVNDIGYMCMSKSFLEGFPCLGSETDEKNWHTGDEATDPWQWKDRVAEEKQLAFGCILGGHKGFIAKKMYPAFYGANRPEDVMEERYADGVVSQVTFELWKLFEHDGVLSTAEIRNALNVTKKNGAGKVNGAIKELQKLFYITVCGNERKKNAFGQEYGWPANAYTKVENWAEEGWLDGALKIDKAEAREQILDVGMKNSEAISREDLSKRLFGKEKSKRA